MSSATKVLLCIGLGAALGLGCNTASTESASKPKPTTSTAPTESEAERRARLDRTVWADEVEAQHYEAVVVALWDRLRDNGHAFEALKKTKFGSLSLPQSFQKTVITPHLNEWKIMGLGKTALDMNGWSRRLETWAQAGYQLIQSEWHHSRYMKANGQTLSRSDVSFQLHIANSSNGHRWTIEGNLRFHWQPKRGDGAPEIARIDVTRCTILESTQKAAFVESILFESRELPILPILVFDVDNDSDLDVLVPGHNTLLRNLSGNLASERLVTHMVERPGAAIPVGGAVIADLFGDKKPELVLASEGGHPLLYTQSAEGKYDTQPVELKLPTGPLKQPTALTVGDIDGDSDLDLWIAQYKQPFVGGQMPTPYYDANDGNPSTLLINKGAGVFVDGTAASGLAAKRYRRTYSASWVDLDEDTDLDLVVVSDFAGVDIYLNDGKGRFTDVSETWLASRNTFGMSHLFGDFNRDGKLDLYVTGMSSTTARRLTAMGLGPESFAKHQEMRPAMGYGNRLYLGGAQKMNVAQETDSLARSGWSWGSVRLDIDNDGDDEIYVANGHISGKTAQDYCTEFWRHDIYTGSSEESPDIDQYFQRRLAETRRDGISWNGFEHNHLFQRHQGTYRNTGFLQGLAAEDDSRSVVAADLDQNGAMDLLVSVSPSPRNGRYRLLHYRNTRTAKSDWVGLTLPASASGARVVLETNKGPRAARYVTGDSYLSQHAPQLHFGLGKKERVLRAVVEWPDGNRWTSEAITPGAYHPVNAPPHSR